MQVEEEKGETEALNNDDRNRAAATKLYVLILFFSQHTPTHVIVSPPEDTTKHPKKANKLLKVYRYAPFHSKCSLKPPLQIRFGSEAKSHEKKQKMFLNGEGERKEEKIVGKWWK